MRALGLGDDHQPAGVLVEAMDDAGPSHAADAGKAGAAMRDQRVDEGAVGVSRGGMDDEAGGLVDDEQICILKTNIERDRLSRRRRILSFREKYDEILARPNPQGWVARCDSSVDDMTLFDQPLEPGARQR